MHRHSQVAYRYCFHTVFSRCILGFAAHDVQVNVLHSQTVERLHEGLSAVLWAVVRFVLALLDHHWAPMTILSLGVFLMALAASTQYKLDAGTLIRRRSTQYARRRVRDTLQLQTRHKNLPIKAWLSYGP